MDKRTFLALLLTALVIVLTPIIFPSARRAPSPPGTAADSARLRSDTSRAPVGASDGPVAGGAATSAAAPAVGPGAAPRPAVRLVAAETTTVNAPRAAYTFVSSGAEIVGAQLLAYRSGRPTDGPVTLASAGPLIAYRVVLGTDTLALDTVPLTRTASPSAITYRGTAGTHGITFTYQLPVDSTSRYLVRVSASVDNAPANSQLLVALPATLRSQEKDTADDLNHLAYVYKPLRDAVSSVSFGKLKVDTIRTDSGPDKWVAVRNKYFLVAVIAEGAPITALRMMGAEKVNKLAPMASATAVLPLQGGATTFGVYAGPQEFDRLRAIGNDIDQVNPYAGWLHAVVQPFAVIVMRILLWMKRTLQVNYGWVLIIFGVVIRLILWPLNQSAMRSSIKMQRLQPELADLQKRYRTEPERQREAIMKVYQEHGMSPFSPMMGCLPMLLPMPVLFALYFVFQNTIEFRGVSFLWMPDLALHDPFYITPIVMGVSMFVLSWIGMRNVPPNPQSKIMAYTMPAMFTVMFMRFPSGLNLYYAVQNIAALPQQWIISKERAKSGPAARTSGAAAKR